MGSTEHRKKRNMIYYEKPDSYLQYLQKIDHKCTIKPTLTDKNYLRFKLQQTS